MNKNREIEHLYGPNVHVLNDLLATSQLTRLCNEQTGQHEVRKLTAWLYREVLMRAVLNDIFPVTPTGVLTPMRNVVGGLATLKTNTIDPATQVAIATLLRAGDVPATACMDQLGPLLQNDKLQQHFFGAGRLVNRQHQVTGTEISYKKDWDLHDRILLIPDPMGATGGTVVQTLDEYSTKLKLVRAIVAMHLIITPEYIRRVTKSYPQVQIYALRLDRGMSDQEVQSSVPGTFPDREIGLNEIQYIVPGAGDLGFRLTGIP